MNTKEQAEIAAQKLLDSMTSKGWEILIHENIGWFYKIVKPIGKSGGITINPFYGELSGPYYCMISLNLLGAGDMEFYRNTNPEFENPNDCYTYAKNLLQEKVDEVTAFLDVIKNDECLD